MTERGDVLDLTKRVEVTYALLDDTWRWRERLVETFEFLSTHYVRVRSSYQVHIDGGLLQTLAGESADAVRVLLPVTTRPKAPLVGFDVEADDSRAYLPPRTKLARVQAGYLEHLLRNSPVRSDILAALPPDLLQAICAFTPGFFDGFRRGWARLVPQLQIARYLRSGLGLPISFRQVRRWQRWLEPARAALLSTLEEKPDRRSSSECVLLALPLLTAMPWTVEEVERRVRGYADAVRLARDADEEAFLTTLAEYGRRWEVIVESALPIGARTLVKVHEDRPLHLRNGGHCTQRLWVGDAASHHAVWRVRDPAVRFTRRVEGRDVLGRIAFGSWEGQRLTDDALAVYTAEYLRDDLVDVTARLRPTISVRAPAVIAQFLALVAIGAAGLGHFDDADRLGALALLVVPTSFVVGLLLVREQTSLAARLQRWTRLRLVFELTVLWLIAIHRVLFD